MVFATHLRSVNDILACALNSIQVKIDNVDCFFLNFLNGFGIAAITPGTLETSEMNYFRSQNISVEKNISKKCWSKK